MAFSKITKLILFILAGISLVVVLFFYISPKTVDIDGMEFRVLEAQNPVDMTPLAPLPTVDTTAIAEDGTAIEDTTVNLGKANLYCWTSFLSSKIYRKN